MGMRSAASGRPTTSSMLADDFTSHRTLFASPARWDLYDHFRVGVGLVMGLLLLLFLGGRERDNRMLGINEVGCIGIYTCTFLFLFCYFSGDYLRLGVVGMACTTVEPVVGMACTGVELVGMACTGVELVGMACTGVEHVVGMLYRC